MSDFSEAMEKLSEATSVMVRGVGMFAEALVEAFGVTFKQAAKNLNEFAAVYALKSNGQAVAPRVTHLAYYAKKKRTRKKNINRLKKILQ